jgi:hypothetical protein
MKATTFLTLATLTLACAGADASTPSPADCTVPCGINLVGLTNTLGADAIGTFEIVVRNLAHDPIAGADVQIVFGGCEPDLRLCRDQPGTGSTTPVTVLCGTGGATARAVTDANGSVRLALIGHASNTHSNAPAAGWQCAKVYADGVLIADLNVGAYDQNGAGGANPADASIWSEDNWDEDYESRSDLNCTHTINPVDLSLILNNFSSLFSCTNRCQ